MRLYKYCLVLLVLSPLTANAAPFVQGVVNTASFVPQGLPMYGVAQGSIFAVFGGGMGPANIAFASFPLQTTLAGTSIQITGLGGGHFDALMFFSQAGQLAALLPSAVPVGNATLTVTFNGQVSNQISFRVVQSAFGIFTANQGGTGPAILQNFVTQASQPFNNILTPAQAGQTEILWGTGLGPFLGDETKSPGSQDPSLSNPIGNHVAVFVGNVNANIQYNGRTPCCTGEDEIVFTVPNGVLGCFVPVQVIVNGVLSNTATMAISSAVGQPCSDPNGFTPAQLSLLQNKANISVLSARLVRQTQTITQTGTQKALQTQGIKTQDQISTLATGTSSTVVSDQAKVDALSVPSAGVLGAPGGVIEPMFSPGQCGVFTFAGSTPPGGPQVVGTIAPRDAGNITVSGSGGTRPVPLNNPGQYRGILGASLGSPGLFLSGNVTVSGTGGADDGAFQASANYGSNYFTVNNGSIDLIPEGTPLTVSWSGGSPNDIVGLTLSSATTNGAAGTAIQCVALNSAGSMTFSTTYLQALPTTQGLLSVTDSTIPASFTASGTDYDSLVTTQESDRTIRMGGGLNAGGCENSIQLFQSGLNGGTLSGTVPIACVNVLNSMGNTYTGGPLTLTATPTTANGTTTWNGTVSGNGTLICNSTQASGTWSVNFPIHMVFAPAINTLAASGGMINNPSNSNPNVTFGTPTAFNICGGNPQFGGTAFFPQASGTVYPTGSIFPNGAVTLSLGSGGGGGPVLFTGTNANSLNGLLLGFQIFDGSATGTVSLNLTAGTGGNYSGGGTGSGTVSCQGITGSNTTGPWTSTITLQSTVALPTSPGAFSGTGVVDFQASACGASFRENQVGTISGNLATNGAVLATFDTRNNNGD